jgi:hypothetical protein
MISQPHNVSTSKNINFKKEISVFLYNFRLKNIAAFLCYFEYFYYDFILFSYIIVYGTEIMFYSCINIHDSIFRKP